MGTILVGLGLIALGVYDYRRHDLPDDVRFLTGTVTGIATARSRISGRSKTLFAPVVSYRDPASGDTLELKPDSYGGKRYQVGDALVLAHIPDSGRVVRVPERRWGTLVALTSVAAVLIGAQIIDWIR